MREQSSSLIGEMDHHRGSRIFLAGSWATSSQIECEPAIELCCLLGIYAQPVYVRIQASRINGCENVWIGKTAKFIETGLFWRASGLGHRNFCRIQKSAASMCFLLLASRWILKSKRRETSFERATIHSTERV